MAKYRDWQPVLCGSDREKELCDRIIQKSGEKNSLNYAGKTSLIELVELIRGAQILLSNETSAVHIAPLVNTKSICIVGGGHYGRFLPYPNQLQAKKPVVAVEELSCFGCNWKCTINHLSDKCRPCVENIKVEHVLELILGKKIEKY